MRHERKHPAHLPNVERHNQPVILFVTVCTQQRRKVLADGAMHGLLVASWKEADAWRVGRYIVMPDHVHLFCSPGMVAAPGVKKWAGYWKGIVSRAIKGCGPLADRWGGAGGTAPSRIDALPGGSASTPTGTMPDPLWQRDCWDTQLRHGTHYDEKWEYVRANPVRKGFVTAPDAWPYQGCLDELRW